MSAKKLKNEKILTVSICSSSKKEIIATIKKRLATAERTVIFTPNPQILLRASKDKDFAKILNGADLNIPDGVGVVLASKLLGGKINSRIAGIDLASSLLRIAENGGYRVFLLGGKKGVAKKAARSLKKRFPRLKICGTHHGYFQKSSPAAEKKLLKKINGTRPDIIFVCLGSPHQEKWIFENSKKISSLRLSIGLGGSLDVWSGKIKRAPEFMQKSGLEWLFRLVREPRRISILAQIPIFIFSILKSK